MIAVILLAKKGLCWSSLCVAGDGEINAMRKIKEMSGNNAMLRRGEGGEGANSGYSPTQDGSCPGE